MVLLSFAIIPPFATKARKDLQGTYSVHDNTLTLIKEAAIYLQGGRLVEATGACASDQEIEGGILQEKSMGVPDTIILTLTGITTDTAFGKQTVVIDENTYWKHREDPTDY